ncbi:hypothetical protein [Agromyces sp. Marseille-P2726]|uniref:COG1470 family protein n=1 Tax=Agromyces sp. Marseille-P2726 TaxID=2709132 RepID=UPI0015712A78|nr:hypothetical protein [Agromyces sp. Marseille-P2726]
MATVDIEPTSLALTPGQAEVLTLTIRNDGDDVEAYHLTVVDEAAEHVVIEPDTLLVHPGQTGTATATITLEHTGRWSVGDLIVRFHIVPAEHPDEFLVVESIATIQSFSDVAAVLSQPALEGRRGGDAEIAIANAGNAHSYAEVSVSAGELAVSIDQSRVALPANTTESVELTVRARSMLWRGEPVQHPFVVTVTPEGGQSISLDGTFTQLPIFAGWVLKAAIAVGAVAAAALLVWIAAVVLGGVRGTPVAVTDSATPSEPPLPEPDVQMVVATTADDNVKAGDPVAFMLEPEVDDAPDDSLLAMEVEWPDGLLLTDDECEAWVAPETDRELEGRPRSGDECLIELSSARNEAELTFATPPTGFAGAVTAGATRLVTLDEEEATTLETGPEADFGAPATAEIALEPYLFWMEVVDAEPSEGEPDARVIIHHTMRGDGSDQATTMAFQVSPPAFVDGILETQGCNSFEDSTCSVFFSDDANDPGNTTWEVGLWFDPDDARGIGPLRVTGTSLTDVASNEVGQLIRGAEGLVVSERMFDVDVRLDSDEDPGQGESVTATIDVTATAPASEIEEYRDGTFTLGLDLDWPAGLVPDGSPAGCATFAGRVCTLPGPEPGKAATVTMSFVVDDPFEGGEVRASGATLTYDPTTAADRRDRREQPAVSLPPHWIGTDAEDFPL